jgi:hypothetical protein
MVENSEQFKVEEIIEGPMFPEPVRIISIKEMEKILKIFISK